MKNIQEYGLKDTDWWWMRKVEGLSVCNGIYKCYVADRLNRFIEEKYKS